MLIKEEEKFRSRRMHRRWYISDPLSMSNNGSQLHLKMIVWHSSSFLKASNS
jgi:hypothetical protein